MMASPHPADLEKYIGKHKTDLPSPSLCLSLPTIKENARVFHENVKAAGVDFRAHVKSNKVTMDVSMREGALIIKDSGSDTDSIRLYVL